ncbi:MAG: peptidase S10 [Acidobacteria bacterium]|nr:peptidase S10 [Acidobacteriota bacterium]
MIHRVVLSSVIVVSISGVLVAQPRRPDQPAPRPAQQAAPAPRGVEPAATPVAVPAPPVEKLSATSHAIQLDGREIRYTATAGTLPIRNDAGKPIASMFFVAYARDGEQPSTRPLAFLYNGGPGAASVWLHMGSFGPRRVVMAAEGFQPAPPYRLADNEQSLLDVSDLVFVDAIDTGFSRPAPGEDPKQFHGVRGDIHAFGEFIRTYLTRFDRWASPKYLVGESYGTMRSAGLAGELQDRHGIELNGIVLVSSILDYLTKGYAPGNDLPYVLFLPTYTATAWHHQRLPADLQGSLQKALDESRAFASGDYLVALARGNRLTPAEEKKIAEKLARLTGLSTEYILQANLRVSDMRFRTELLRDQRRTVGRLDGRMTGLNADAAAERQEYDPSDLAIKGAYTATFNDYVRRELKWESDQRYPTSGDVRPWSYDEFNNRYLNLADTLRGAMARNPHLKVLVVNGYYDFATPFGATEHTFAHLGFDATYKARVELAYYEAGHMMYIRPSEHRKLKQDVARFIKAASSSAQR